MPDISMNSTASSSFSPFTTQLPKDLLIQSILPLLPIHDLLELSATCHSLRRTILAILDLTTIIPTVSSITTLAPKALRPAVISVKYPLYHRSTVFLDLIARIHPNITQLTLQGHEPDSEAANLLFGIPVELHAFQNLRSLAMPMILMEKWKKWRHLLQSVRNLEELRFVRFPKRYDREFPGSLVSVVNESCPRLRLLALPFETVDLLDSFDVMSVSLRQALIAIDAPWVLAALLCGDARWKLGVCASDSYPACRSSCAEKGKKPRLEISVATMSELAKYCVRLDDARRIRDMLHRRTGPRGYLGLQLCLWTVGGGDSRWQTGLGLNNAFGQVVQCHRVHLSDNDDDENGLEEDSISYRPMQSEKLIIDIHRFESINSLHLELSKCLQQCAQVGVLKELTIGCAARANLEELILSSCRQKQDPIASLLPLRRFLLKDFQLDLTLFMAEHAQRGCAHHLPGVSTTHYNLHSQDNGVSPVFPVVQRCLTLLAWVGCDQCWKGSFETILCAVGKTAPRVVIEGLLILDDIEEEGEKLKEILAWSKKQGGFEVHLSVVLAEEEERFILRGV